MIYDLLYAVSYRSSSVEFGRIVLQVNYMHRLPNHISDMMPYFQDTTTSTRHCTPPAYINLHPKEFWSRSFYRLEALLVTQAAQERCYYCTLLCTFGSWLKSSDYLIWCTCTLFVVDACTTISVLIQFSLDCCTYTVYLCVWNMSISTHYTVIEKCFHSIKQCKIMFSIGWNLADTGFGFGGFIHSICESEPVLRNHQNLLGRRFH